MAHTFAILNSRNPTQLWLDGTGLDGTGGWVTEGFTVYTEDEKRWRPVDHHGAFPLYGLWVWALPTEKVADREAEVAELRAANEAHRLENIKLRAQLDAYQGPDTMAMGRSEHYTKMRLIERRLHGGSDAMRDEGHKLWLVLNDIFAINEHWGK